MADKQVNELTTISGAEYGNYFVLYDDQESGDEKLKKLDVWDLVYPTPLELYVSESSGNDSNDGSSSNPLETIDEAISRMTNAIHAGGSIMLEEGTYSAPTWGVGMDVTNLNNLLIIGEADDGVSITSIQSSSGEASEWSYVLNCDDVSGISVGNYVNIYETSNISNSERMHGCWEVTAVDGVNDRITVTVSDPASSALSGSLNGSVTILKTVITGGDGEYVFTVGNGCSLNVSDICIVPDGGYSCGLYIDGGYVGIMNDYGFGINGGDPGIFCINGGTFENINWNDKSVCISNFMSSGIQLDYNSNAVLNLYSRQDDFIISGSTTDEGAGLSVVRGSAVWVDSSILICGMMGDGVVADYCGTISTDGASIWSREIDGDAFTAENNAMIDATASVLNCDGTGWVAHFGGIIHHYDATNADGSDSSNGGHLYGVV